MPGFQMLGILVPITLFIAVAAVVIAAMVQARRSRDTLMQTVQKSIEAGVPLTPETIQAIGARPRDGMQDLRTGAILLAVWGGFIVLGLMMALEDLGRQGFEWDEMAPLIGVGALPGMVGIALIGLHASRKDRR